MKIGYARVSKADGSQILDLQLDALHSEGINDSEIYKEYASGSKEDRPVLASCLKALRKGDQLVIWSLDRLGRNTYHMLKICDDLQKRGIDFKVLTGFAGGIDTSTSTGKFIFTIMCAFAEQERNRIRERTIAGLKSARKRGRVGGRKHKLNRNKVLMAQAAMKDKNTSVLDLCKELNITKSALYTYVSPGGELREKGVKILAGQKFQSD